MTRQRLFLIIAGAILLLASIILTFKTNHLYLVIAFFSFLAAYFFCAQIRVFITIGIFFLAKWAWPEITSMWTAIFGPNLALNFLVPIIVFLGIWSYRQSSGLRDWKTISCIILTLAWIGGNASVIFTGLSEFKNAAPTIDIPPAGKKLVGSIGKVVNASADYIDNEADKLNKSIVSPKPQPTPAPASNPAPTPQPVPVAKIIAQPAVTYQAYAPKNAHNTLQVPEGIWEVSPPGALARRANSADKQSVINQQIPGEVYVYPPPGTSANVVLTKKN